MTFGVPGINRDMIESLVENNIHHIIINRPEERNAFTIDMLRDLARAYTESENNENILVTVVYARGNHFTLGLDLPEVSAWIQKNRSLPVPWGLPKKSHTMHRWLSVPRWKLPGWVSGVRTMRRWIISCPNCWN